MTVQAGRDETHSAPALTSAGGIKANTTGQRLNLAAGNVRASEIREGFELAIAVIDFRVVERAEAIRPELFAAEAAHHRSINDRPAEHLVIELAVLRADALLRQVAHESAREAVARAGGIEYIIQQKPGHDEV